MTSEGRSNLIMGGILFLGLLVGAGSVYFFIVTRHTALNKELLQQATRQSELAREKAKLAEELSLKQKRANEQTTLLKQVREAHLAYLAWKWDKLLDQKHVENVFSKAFQKAGLKPEMTLQESLIAVKESSIKAELAVLMDLQAALLNREQDRTLARALDDDADRAKIRDWLQNKQKEPLEKFSQSLDFTRASVQTVTLLIHALDVLESTQLQPILQRARWYHPSAASIHARLGILESNAKMPKREEVVRCFSPARAAMPKSATVHLLSAFAFQKLSMTNEASALIERAKELMPDLPVPDSLKKLLNAKPRTPKEVSLKKKAFPPELVKGAELLLKNQHRQAIPHLRAALLADPFSAEALAFLGVASGDTPEAIARLREAVHLRGGDVWAWHQLAQTLRRQGRAQEASGALGVAAVLEETPETIKQEGLIALQNLKLDKALEKFQKAKSDWHIALVLILQGKADQAIDHLRKAKAPVALGKAHLLNGEPKQALPLFQMNQSHHLLGEAHLRLREWKKAEDAFREHLKAHPNDADVHHMLARTLTEQRKHSEARTAFQSAWKLKPTDSLIQRQYLSCLEELAQRSPRDADLRLEQAEVALQSGFYLQSINSCRVLFRLAPDHPRALQLISQALMEVGSPNQAEAYLMRASQRGAKWAQERLVLALIEMGRLSHARQLVAQFRLSVPPLLTRMESAEKQLRSFILKPSTPFTLEQKLDLATLSAFRGLHGAASRTFRELLDQMPGIAHSKIPGLSEVTYHFLTITSLVHAACGQSADARSITTENRFAYSQLARTWLELELERARSESLTQRQRRLRGWLAHQKLFCVQNLKLLASLPESEQKAWEKFWRKVTLLAFPPSPSDEFTPQRFLIPAQGLLQHGFVNDALSTLQKGERYFPRSTEIQSEIADVFVRQNNREKALATVEKLSKANPDSALALARLGTLQTELGKFKDAMKSLRQSLSLDPLETSARVALARLLMILNKQKEAIVELKQAVEQRPNDVRILTQLFDACIIQKEWAEAQKASRKILDLNPGNLAARHQILTALRLAVEEESADVTRLMDYASELDRQGFLLDALVYYRRAQKQKNAPKDVAEKLDRLLTLIGESEKPVTLPNEMKQLNAQLDDYLSGKKKPMSPKMKYGLAVLAYEKKEHEQAAKWSKELFEVDSRWKTLIWRGETWRYHASVASLRASLKTKNAQLRRQAGEWLFEDSQFHIRRAQQGRASRKEVRRQFHIWLCSTLLRPSRLEKTVSQFTREERVNWRTFWGNLCQISQMPTDPMLTATAEDYVGLGLAFSRMGLLPQAQNRLEQAASLSTSDRFARYEAACAALEIATAPDTAIRELSEDERQRWRKLARDWFQLDLREYAQSLTTGQFTKALVQHELRNWKSDPRLRIIRDANILKTYEEEERTSWQAMWRDLESVGK